jgi:hypothetical protein
MSSRLDLSPTDLDRLEDALEDLELASLDDLPDDDPVAQRLSEYRELLLLGRDALPLEDVPAGLLDGVIAEARQAAAATPAAAPSFWSRWRLGVWVPALAFAGSAALLLVVLVPEQSPEAEEAKVAQSEPAEPEDASRADAKAAPAADGRLAFAEPAREQGEGFLEGEAYRGVAIGELAPAPAPVEEQAAADEDEPEPVAEPPARRKAVATGSSGAAAGAKPKPASKASAVPGGSSKGKTEPWPDPLGGAQTGDKKDAPEKKTDAGLWSEIERADADRRGGSCGLAKMRYDKLRKADDARVRARALAGAGLCAAASDDMSTAKKLFAQARAADPGVSSFIDRELASIEDARANAKDPVQSKE